MLTGAGVRGCKYSGWSKCPVCALNILRTRMGSRFACRTGSRGVNKDTAAPGRGVGLPRVSLSSMRGSLISTRRTSKCPLGGRIADEMGGPDAREGGATVKRGNRYLHRQDATMTEWKGTLARADLSRRRKVSGFDAVVTFEGR
ncbi:hypothetical protein EYF80_028515 [Liparis tanakae]|uniref:Uncharacterized protein n=1 Tax=Liparis tanakae TaxID=230148 RepID=A0A4Z2H6T7_9TELE|nr:hypothetical protein EYF80_028515 [Liparis tanakae]